MCLSVLYDINVPFLTDKLQLHDLTKPQEELQEGNRDNTELDIGPNFFFFEHVLFPVYLLFTFLSFQVNSSKVSLFSVLL